MSWLAFALALAFFVVVVPIVHRWWRRRLMFRQARGENLRSLALLYGITPGPKESDASLRARVTSVIERGTR